MIVEGSPSGRTPTPVPRSAIEWLAEQGEDAQRRIEASLRVSALVPVAENVVGYYRWRDLDPSDSALRYRALRAFQTFRDGLAWVFGRHDPALAPAHAAEQVFSIIDQRADTHVEDVAHAKAQVTQFFVQSLEDLSRLDDELEDEVLVLADTNALIDYPDLANYHLGLPRVRLVLVSAILKELDLLKRRHDKHSNVREQAKRLIRTLAQWGDRGDILRGSAISERVMLMTRANEPQPETVPNWLDLEVADDRFIGSALELFWEHPKAKVLVATGDFAVVVKARNAGLGAVYAPSIFEPETGPG